MMLVEMWGYVYKGENNRVVVGAASEECTRDTWEECLDEPCRKFKFFIELDGRLFQEPTMLAHGCEVEDAPSS